MVNRDPTQNSRPGGLYQLYNQSLAPIYEYSSLSHPDSVRIFVLTPSLDTTTPIHGEIVEHRLLDNCEEQGYTALSYAWGDLKITHTIHIKDSQLRVGKNLNSALLSIRRTDCPVRLWVDTLCINQNDVKERNHQVQQMRIIYSSAVKTIIYLGGRSSGYVEYSAWNYLERNSIWALNKDRNADADLPARAEARTAFRGELADVEISVLSRPWFSRLWVFQEVVVSKELLVQCGNRGISWNDFCKILLLPSRDHDRYGFSLQLSERVEIVRDMFQARCSYQDLYGLDSAIPYWRSQVQEHEYKTLDILNLLQRTRFQLEASDPRDKIFGLLGVSSGIDAEHPDFAIDYSQDCRGVYTRFARNFIRATKSYDILSYLDHGLIVGYEDLGPMVNKHRLPSWVPDWDLSKWNDWSLRNTRTILSTLPPQSLISKFQSRRSFDTNCRWIDSGNTLVARGFIIGQIDCVSDIITVRGADELYFQGIQDLDITEEERNGFVMNKWAISWQDKGRAQASGNELFSDIARSLICIEECSRKGTVENHLLRRARKTALYDSSLLPSILVDKTSVVDGKRVAVYHTTGLPRIRKLAIVPAQARKNDCLIDLKGGRVPFTIRTQDSPQNSDSEFDIQHCRLIGESVVNRVSTLILVDQEISFGIH